MRKNSWLWFLLIGVVSVPVNKALAQEQSYTYKNDGKRDPFVPLISASGYLVNLEPEDKTTFKLEGIMYDQKGESIAIVNGQLVKAGETIGDSVVSAIEQDKVTVIKDNQKIDIPLRKEE